MAPSSRKNLNGRSPLVNKQHQITAFFSKSSSLNPKPKPNPSRNPNPKPSISPGSSPPTTPSPLNTKSKPHSAKAKPQLIIGSSKSVFGEEVLNRRIRVYWPLDKEWYEGCVKSFDKDSGKHLVAYDDADEELLDLCKEKFEWLDDVEGSVRKFRRLRKVSVILDDDDEEEGELNGGNVGPEDDDDSSDEDWGKNAVVEDEEEDGGDCLEDMELEDEEKEKEGKKLKRKRGESAGGTVKKVKVGGGERNEGGSSKEKKGGFVFGEFGSKAGKPVVNNGQSLEAQSPNVVDNVINSDALDRFGNREEKKLPFLGKDRRDAKRRLADDPNYDPRTLYLPPHFLKSLTGGQRQWWEFKSNHMDKVLFFKMGKFYELFEMDAHIGVKELDLQYMKGEQPHCGFPEKNFSVNLEKLARKGYRVLVVEQTETPDQLEIRRREEGSKDKVVKREICAVVTKGTSTEGEMLSANPNASYIVSVSEGDPTLSNNKDEHLYGVCVVDVATSHIIIGQIKDDIECSNLCCLLFELRPVEIIKPMKRLSLETEKAISRYTRNPLVNELVPGSEFWDAERTIRELKTFYSRINDSSRSSPEEAPVAVNGSSNEDKGCCLPNVLKELFSAGPDGSLALSALGGTLYYLRQAFLDETLLRYAKYEPLPCSDFCDVSKKSYMVLDAAALENLEIFENSRNGDSSGTLYSQLNHCATAFGKRLLKAWLARPLYHTESIKERQDAIAGLKGPNLSVALEFRKDLMKLPDMERLLTRLFSSSEAHGRNSNKIVLYEDASKKQLQEFISTLRGCEVMTLACASLGFILDNTDSALLHHLLIPGEGLPDVNSIVEQFKDAFDWVEANSSGRIIPHEGVDEEYDSACKKIEDISLNLKKHLKEQKSLLGDTSITYVTVGKDIYLLQVPESMCQSIPQDYELRSSKKGFSRYWTPYIKKMLGELTQAESVKESRLKRMLQRLIGRFCEHHSKWRQLVTTVAELDVLISLVIASDYYEGPTCRPIISTHSNPNEVPHLTAKSLGHPIIRSDSLGKGTFVPNDINIGGLDHASFILLTGPNMGGKSTLLRQICLAVILAQVGADVPAEQFQLSLVDRIFVRMGAKDHIMAGQSTFLTELSETASMLTSATRDSLVALDELGRGTSSSDGQAIAESVLEHFVRKVQCRGMFSTHYHRLAIDYTEDTKVSLCHMACQVGKGDRGLEEVTFLYRLTLGACPKSYGVNVARLAGIPDSVLSKAAAKSREFEASYGRQREAAAKSREFEASYRRQREICNKSLPSWEKEAFGVIQDLVGFGPNASSYKMDCNTSISSLYQLQHRARILLEQC